MEIHFVSSLITSCCIINGSAFVWQLGGRISPPLMSGTAGKLSIDLGGNDNHQILSGQSPSRAQLKQVHSFSKSLNAEVVEQLRGLDDLVADHPYLSCITMERCRDYAVKLASCLSFTPLTPGWRLALVPCYNNELCEWNFLLHGPGGALKLITTESLSGVINVEIIDHIKLDRLVAAHSKLDTSAEHSIAMAFLVLLFPEYRAAQRFETTTLARQLAISDELPGRNGAADSKGAFQAWAFEELGSMAIVELIRPYIAADSLPKVEAALSYYFVNQPNTYIFLHMIFLLWVTTPQKKLHEGYLAVAYDDGRFSKSRRPADVAVVKKVRYLKKNKNKLTEKTMKWVGDVFLNWMVELKSAGYPCDSSKLMEPLVKQHSGTALLFGHKEISQLVLHYASMPAAQPLDRALKLEEVASLYNELVASNWMSDQQYNMIQSIYANSGNSLKLQYRPARATSLLGNGFPVHSVPVFTFTLRHLVSVPSKQFSLLNLLFPSTHLQDTKHYTTKLASLYTLLHDKKLRNNVVSRYLKGFIGSEVISGFLQDLRLFKQVWRDWLRYLPIGVPQVRVTGILLLAGSSVQDQLFKAILQRNILFGNLAVVTKRLSSISCSLRKYRYLNGHGPVDEDSVHKLAYLELSSGRSMQRSNWAQEIANRCTATLPLFSSVDTSANHWLSTGADVTQARSQAGSAGVNEYYSMLKNELNIILRQLINHTHPITESLSEFYARRHEWVTSGSAGSTKLGDLWHDAGISSSEFPKNIDARSRVTKRVWADRTPYSRILQALRQSKAEEHAVASEKFENGKARAIYGVEPVHYVLNTYSTAGLESTLQYLQGFEKGASAFNVLSYGLKRSFITTYLGTECTMFDYADFNIHHTPLAQALIFETLARLGREAGYHPDWVEANEWVAKSKFNMTVTVASEGNNVKRHVKQGMFSGTRSTDFINTLLNMAYFQVASKMVAAQYSVSPSNLYHVHQGDDVWVSNDNLLWARLVYYRLNSSGLVFQAKKQMFGQGRGEYLRILYSHGQSYGYLNRAVVNYILRPVQNDQVNDVTALARMFDLSFSLLWRRGLAHGMVRLLWLDAVNHWIVVRWGKLGGGERALRLQPKLVWLNQQTGGLGLAFPGHTPAYLSSTSKLEGTMPPSFSPVMDQQLMALGSPMTQDWLAHISPRVHSEFHATALKKHTLFEQTMMANYHELLLSSRSVTPLIQYKAAMSKWADCMVAGLGSQPLHIVDKGLTSGAIDLLQAVLDKVAGAVEKVPANLSGLDLYYNIPQNSNYDVARKPAHDLQFIGNHISRFETASAFKSVETTATALGISKLQALSMIVAVDTRQTIAKEEVSYILSDKGRGKSPRFIEFLTGRQVGSAALLDTMFPDSFISTLHASVVNNMLKQPSLEWVANSQQLIHIDLRVALGCLKACCMSLGDLEAIAY